MLYLQTWIDEVNNRSDLLRQYNAGISFGIAEEVAAASAPNWLQTRLHELTNLINSLNHLVSASAPETFGKPAEAGNSELIVWTARTIGELFENALQWALRVRRARAESPFDAVPKELARFPEDMLEQLVEFPKDALARVERAIEDSTAGEIQELQLTLKVGVSNEEALSQALEEAGRHLYE